MQMFKNVKTENLISFNRRSLQNWGWKSCKFRCGKKRGLIKDRLKRVSFLYHIRSHRVRYFSVRLATPRPRNAAIQAATTKGRRWQIFWDVCNGVA